MSKEDDTASANRVDVVGTFWADSNYRRALSADADHRWRSGPSQAPGRRHPLGTSPSGSTRTRQTSLRRLLAMVLGLQGARRGKRSRTTVSDQRTAQPGGRVNRDFNQLAFNRRLGMGPCSTLCPCSRGIN